MMRSLRFPPPSPCLVTRTGTHSAGLIIRIGSAEAFGVERRRPFGADRRAPNRRLSSDYGGILLTIGDWQKLRAARVIICVYNMCQLLEYSI